MNSAKSSRLTIVVIFHNMIREAERTLFTLGADYQSGVSSSDYEVIAIDNGSTKKLNSKFVSGYGFNFTYHNFETSSASPASAVNFGVSLASSEYIGVIVDGARMVTPGLISSTLKALDSFEDSFACTLAWHIGPDVQNVSMQSGYDQSEEDRLLGTIPWQSDGYRLFEVSTLAQSSRVGLEGEMPSECSWFGMRRKTFLELNGFDERFQSPGGGLVNHDFLNRVLARPTVSPVIILGEGCFHQFHGGVATNVTMVDHPWKRFLSEYRSIHGKDWERMNSRKPYIFEKAPH